MQVIDPAPELWDRLAAESPEATFFHTRVWADSITAAYPSLRVAVRGFKLDDGAAAMLPLIERRWLGGALRSYESMLPMVYGGPIGERALTSDEAAAMIATLVDARTARLRINGNPFATWRLPHYATNQTFAQMLDLSPGMDAIVSGFWRGQRENLKKARRAGLEFCLASSDANYTAEYATFEDSMRRWGRRTAVRLPERLFLELRDRGGDTVRLWLVKKDGEVVGGLMMLYHGETAYAWHASFLERARQFQPYSFLLYRAICDAAGRGCRWFDFGTSGDYPGLVQFKESFGAQRFAVERATLTPNVAFKAMAGARAMARRVSGNRRL